MRQTETQVLPIMAVHELHASPHNLQKKLRDLQEENAELKRALDAAQVPPSEPLDRQRSSVSTVSSMTFSLEDAQLPGDPLFDQVTSVMRDDDHVATASGSGSGLMEHDRVTGRYLGRGAGALYVCESDEPEAPAQSFAFPLMPCDTNALDSLPKIFPQTKVEAHLMVQAYYDRVEWMYCPTDRSAILAVLDSIYSAPSLQTGLHQVAAHRLASVAMVFALALSFTQAPDPTHTAFYTAACALLAVPAQHFMVRHSVAAVETLHLMVTYLFAMGKSGSARAAWPLLGLQSLNFGRPYAVPLLFSDCPPPAFDELAIPDDAHFHSLKYRLARQFFKIADCLAATDLPAYDVVLQLDAGLRATESSGPTWLRWTEVGHADWQSSPRQSAQQHAATLFVHKALLALHRPWFFKAVMSGAEPLLSPYSASFNVCVSSARKHTRLMASILRQNTEAAYGWWFFIFHVYTAAIIQATILLRVPGCMMADEVRADFFQSFDIVAQMASASAVARRALPMLTRLKGKMHAGKSPVTSVMPDEQWLNLLLGDTFAAPPTAAPQQDMFDPWGGGMTSFDNSLLPMQDGWMADLPFDFDATSGQVEVSTLDPLLQTFE
ncbi:hypothetical protein Q5752_006720 [Cryptotrichosporon argae]